MSSVLSVWNGGKMVQKDNTIMNKTSDNSIVNAVFFSRKRGKGYVIRLNEDNTKMIFKFADEPKRKYSCKIKSVRLLEFEDDVIKTSIIECMENKDEILNVDDVVRKNRCKRKTEIENLSEKEALLDKLSREYSFDGLYHYTDFSNLASILEKGYLYARNAEENKKFYDAAKGANILRAPQEIKDCVRLFYKGNTPTTYRNEGIIVHPGERAHMPIPVLLKFSKEIFLHKDICYLEGSGSNVISNDDVITRVTESAVEATEFAWELIFERGSMALSKHIRELRTNLRNSEFLYPHSLSLSFLREIVFRTDIDRQNAMLRFDSKYNRLFSVDEKQFNLNKPDINYPKEYSACIEDNTIAIEIKYFSTNICEYQHSFKVQFADGERRVDAQVVKISPKCIRYIIDCGNIQPVGVDYLMDKTLCIMWRA